MALYKHLQADRLLLDDHRARKVARLNEIEVIGSLGSWCKPRTTGSSQSFGLCGMVAGMLSQARRDRDLGARRLCEEELLEGRPR
jgi:hypothetical protein